MIPTTTAILGFTEKSIIRKNLKLRNEVKSVIASVDSVISQTACEKGVHSSEISELTHILNTLQVA